ncbi:hypothetical protein DMB66_13210 [Actinoplanes sp. ATCC 53533]|nr:hypothetical protein DMB66_13210 [Actinoplanes sp. ATCC 53533]
MMRTYYRGSDALVTDDHFVWRASSTHIFAIGELRNIVIVRGPLTGVSQGPALAAGAGLLLLAATSWMLFGSAVGYTATAAAILFTLMIMSVTGRRTTRLWHLLATYRGGTVTIYSAPDLRVFNQVARALRRSLENTHPVRRPENTHPVRRREDLAAA